MLVLVWPSRLFSSNAHHFGVKSRSEAGWLIISRLRILLITNSMFFHLLTNDVYYKSKALER